MNPLTWQMPKILVYVALFCIVFLRASATYWLGRGIIAGLSRNTRVKAQMDSAHYQRAAGLIDRYGAPVVSLCFLTVGFQTVVLLAAGASKMSLKRFVPALAVGSVFWALLYGTVGFVGLGLWWQAFQGNPIVTVAGTITVAALIVGYVLRAKKAGQQVTDTAAK